MREETGLAEFDLGPHIWNRVFWFGGEHLDLRETWFLARIVPFDVDTGGFTDLERATVREHRWWTPMELAHTTETLGPRDLARLMREILDHGPPLTPLTIGVGTLETEIPDVYCG